MKEVKNCVRCGTVISDINSADYYSHISIQYCKACKAAVKKEKTLLRVQKLRTQKRAEKKELQAEKKELQDKIRQLETENQVLRRMLRRSPNTETKCSEFVISTQPDFSYIPDR